MRLWDLPTRLFHWALAICVGAACISANSLGEQALRLHFYSGYAVLTLLCFRLFWGFAGPRCARFAQFIRGPVATARYALFLLHGQADGRARHVGHNPLGALSVLALLATCAVLAISGLYAKDYIASEGPLARLASESMVDRCSTLHAWGEPILYFLVALHVIAIAFYRFARGQDLLSPMLTGSKSVQPQSAAARNQAAPLLGRADCSDSLAPDAAVWNLRALLLFALSSALVTYVVQL